MSRLLELDVSATNTEPVRKRQCRRPLACAECRRRKAKCDRQIPCSECTKRGEANLCYGAFRDSDKLQGDLPLPYHVGNAISYHPANAAVVEHLAKRVSALESLLKSVPRLPESAAFAATSTVSDSPPHAAAAPSASPADSAEDDGLEEAVQSLESIAMAYVGEPIRTEREAGRNALPFVLDNSAIAPSPASAISDSTLSRRAPPRMLQALSSYSLHGSMLQTIVAGFPEVSTCRILLDAFYDHVEILLPYLDIERFRSQSTHFDNQRFYHRYDQLDPAWLALYANCLARGAAAVRLRNPTYSLPPELQVQLYAACQMALVCAQWTEKPQLYVVQTLIGMVNYISYSGSLSFSESSDVDLGGGAHARLLIGTAVSLARQLGLHRVTAASTVEECPFFVDPALPFNGPSSLHCEMARRWWWALVALDAKSCNGRKHERHIAQGSYITALPTRTNRDRLGSYLTVPPLPSGQWCDADGTLYQCYLVELQDNAMAHSTSYERVRILDALWRPHYREFTGLDIGNLGNLTKAAIDAPQKATLASGIHARLLRIHRPYFLRGLQDQRFEYSSNTCLQCAQIILAANAPAHVVAYSHTMWWSYQHVMSAVVVIVLAHYHRVFKRNFAVGHDEGLSVVIEPARQLFLRGSSSSSQVIRSTGKQCLRVLDMLLRLASASTQTPQTLLVALVKQASKDAPLLEHASPPPEASKGQNSYLSPVYANSPQTTQFEMTMEELTAFSNDLMRYMNQDHPSHAEVEPPLITGLQSDDEFDWLLA